MKTDYITLNVRRLETPEERMERESREVALRAVAAAIIALCVAAIILAWLAIFSNRDVIAQVEAREVAVNVEISTASMVPQTFTPKEANASQESAADLYVVEHENQVNPSPLSDEEWTALLDACEENCVAPSLALGLIEVESDFNPNAIAASGSGCYGYCQISPVWHPANLNPIENIQYGVRYLASLCEKYDSTEAGLTAYNAGYDTGYRGYANAVLQAAEEWEEMLNGR